MKAWIFLKGTATGNPLSNYFQLSNVTNIIAVNKDTVNLIYLSFDAVGYDAIIDPNSSLTLRDVKPFNKIYVFTNTGTASFYLYVW